MHHVPKNAFSIFTQDTHFLWFCQPSHYKIFLGKNGIKMDLMHFHLMALSWSDIDTEYYCQCRVNSSCHLIHTNFIPLNPLLHHRTPTFKCMNFLSHVPNNNTTDGPISSSKVTLSGSRLIGSNFCEPPCNTHKHTLSGSRLIVSNFCEPPCNTHKHTHTHFKTQ